MFMRDHFLERLWLEATFATFFNVSLSIFQSVEESKRHLIANLKTSTDTQNTQTTKSHKK